MTELDEVLLDVIRPRVQEGLKFLVVLTKADKLTRAESTKALSIAKLQAGGGEVRLFSAPKRIGVEDVATLLWDWAHPKGAALTPLVSPMAAPHVDEDDEPESLDEPDAA
jgi:GTP-binding protein